jgi:hypothetical protein
MKEICIKIIPDFYGKPIKCVAYDDLGEPIMEENKRGIRDMTGKLIEEPVVKDATIIDVINILIRSYPRDRMTIDNIQIALKIRDKLNCQDKLILEDNEYDWIIKQMKNNDVGAKLFALDLPQILAALGEKL